jgi:hypothetical protein
MLKESGAYRIDLIEGDLSKPLFAIRPFYIVGIDVKYSGERWTALSDHNQIITKTTPERDEIEIRKAFKKLEPVMQELVDRDKNLEKIASRIKCEAN